MATSNALSNYVQDLLLKQFFLNQRFPAAPATVYLAAFTVAPSNAGGGSEVSAAGTAYARVSMTTGTVGTGAGSAWSESGTSPTVITNVGDLLFAVATANWGTVVAIGVFDASSGGNLIFWSNLAANETVNTNDQLKISAGSLTFSID